MNVTDGTIYEDGVNIAARLESLAEPGGVAIFQSFATVARHVNVIYIDISEQMVKNIAQPVRVFRVRLPALVGLLSVPPVRDAALWEGQSERVRWAAPDAERALAR